MHEVEKRLLAENRRNRAEYLITAGFFLLLAGRDCTLLAGQPADQPTLSFGKAKPPPELNALFRGRTKAGSAVTVPIPRCSCAAAHAVAVQRYLGRQRWRGGKRQAATIVNNTLGLQDGQGKDAKLEFVVRKDAGGKPAAFVVPAENAAGSGSKPGLVRATASISFYHRSRGPSIPASSVFARSAKWVGNRRQPA